MLMHGNVLDIVRLWRMCNTEDEKVLHARYSSILKKMKPQGDLETLKELVEVASKMDDMQSFNLLTRLCNSLSKKNAKSDRDGVIQVYREAFMKMHTKKSKLKPKFFEEVAMEFNVDFIETLVAHPNAKPFLVLKNLEIMVKVVKNHSACRDAIDGFVRAVLAGDEKLCRGVLKSIVPVGRKVKGWKFVEDLEGLKTRYSGLDLLIRQVQKSFE